MCPLGRTSVRSWILIFRHTLGSSHKELCRWDRQGGAKGKWVIFLGAFATLKARAFTYPSDWEKLRILIGDIWYFGFDGKICLLHIYFVLCVWLLWSWASTAGPRITLFQSMLFGYNVDEKKNWFPAGATVCVEFVRSSLICVGFLRVLQPPPTSQRG